MDKEKTQEFYKLFRKECGGNTEYCLACLTKLKEDGFLKNLIGMEDLTVIEQQYINQLLEN